MSARACFRAVRFCAASMGSWARASAASSSVEAAVSLCRPMKPPVLSTGSSRSLSDSFRASGNGLWLLGSESCKRVQCLCDDAAKHHRLATALRQLCMVVQELWEALVLQGRGYYLEL